MRTRLTSRLSLLFLTFALVMIVFPAMAFAEVASPDGTTATSPPTITSDKADYAPGELVTLTGSGWQPGESVHINVDDDQTKTWNRDVDVTADQNGNISDSFNLPDWFVATYKVTATGEQSGTATTSFTDGNMRFRTQSLSSSGPVQFSVTWTQYSSSSTCQGGQNTRTTGSGTVLNNFGGTFQKDVPANQSISLTAPSPEDNQTFKKWTGTGTFSTSGTNGETICVSGSNSAGDFTANYSTDNTAPTVFLNQLNGVHRAFPYATTQNVTSVGGSCTGGDGAVSVTLNGNATSPATAACNSGSWTLTLSNPLTNEATYTFAASQTDGSFNTGSSGDKSVRIDRTAPNVTITSTELTTIGADGVSHILWNTNETGSLSVRVGGTDCATATQVTSGTALSGVDIPANATVVSTVNASALAEGSNTVRVCVTDAASNVGQATTTITKSSVRPTDTTLARTTGSSPSTYGDSLTFTATVNSSAGSPTAGQGTVTFKDGTSAISAACSNVALDANSKATCTTSALNVAGSPHSITAEYSGVSSGSPQFQASTSNALSQTVNKATPVITWSNPAAITYGTLLGATQLNAEANVPGSFSYTPNAGTKLDVGTKNLTADFTPSNTANYNTASKTVQITVEKADQTINFGELNFNPQKKVGDAPFTVSATASSGLDVSFSSTTPAKCSVSGNQVTILGAGTCTIRASQAGNTNYNAAPNVDRSFEIAKGTAQVTLNSADLNPTYDGSAKSVRVSTVPTGLSVSVTYNGSTTAPTNAGTYTVVATVNDDNYEGSQSGTLTINKAAGSVSITNIPANAVFGGSFTPSLSAAGDGQKSVSSLTEAKCTVGNAGVVSFIGAGTCTLKASVAEGTNHLAGSSQESFEIAKAPAQVTLSDLTQTYNGSAKTVGVETNPANLNVSVTYNGSTTAPTNAGTYNVVATINEANYQGSASGTLTIEKATATVQLGNLGPHTWDGSAKAATVSTNPANLNVSVTYNTSTTAPSAVGSYNVVATVNEANYQGSATGTLVISPWSLKGFFSPVDMFDSTGKHVVNTVKAGSTVPLKFEVFRVKDDPTSELRSNTDITSVQAFSSNYCSTGLATDEIEELTTATAGLRFDTTGDFFIYNWKTPKAGCYKMEVKTKDGSTLNAYFRTR